MWGANKNDLGYIWFLDLVLLLLPLIISAGLFAGVSLEGTALIERKDANKEFYGSAVPARDILGGRVPPPEVASRLYEIIEAAEVSG